MTLNDATRAQIAASNPLASTWLTANAGSGKTKVLTDRVARLLLLGVDPQSILCLTYTKAAAAEMQNRLFKRLGAWAMLPEDALAKALAEAGVDQVANLAEARTLFARAIEVPGGLKIQTIHAFAASILRRFPLEAGVSPDFRELDDNGAEALRRDIVNQIAVETPGVVADLARFHAEDDLDGIAQTIASNRVYFRPPLSRDQLAANLGVDPNQSQDDLLARLIGADGSAIISALKSALEPSTTRDTNALKKLVHIDPSAISAGDHPALETVFLNQSGNAKHLAKVGKFPTDAARKILGVMADRLDAMMERAEALREPRLALIALDRTVALHSFAAAFLPMYAQAKAVQGALDFDDLIEKADALLSDPSVANWVLYKIDGDIEHVLVDEAQDTSPAQWRLIQKLTQELAAGQGAETQIPRSIFVVGDLKQSIYSFQGADPDEMEHMAQHYGARLGGGLTRHELVFSFRSSDAILRVVDQTFGPLAGQGVGDGVAHAAFHDRLPGRVDLWPIEEPADKEDPPAWQDPCDVLTPSDPTVRLAQKAAHEIGNWLETETIPAGNGSSRPVEAEDILILFRRRNALFHQTIRACKEAGLDVAGADRLLLQDDLGVADIMSVLRFLALPEDDLALAEALRSPLFGWSEDALFRLAYNRGDAFLWQALRGARADHPETLAILDDLRAQADFLRPFEIMDRLLTRHGGRARLLAQLGDETEEAIDVLLDQALQFETRGAPSLTSFIAWYGASEVEVKRQAPAADAGIRVMTVHGAKGLESPIIMLLDTISDRARMDILLFGDDGTPYMAAGAANRSATLERAATTAARKARDERNRLLYVAMTRAETWLVVAGAGKAPTSGESWYEKISAGLGAAGPTTKPALADGTPIQRFSTGQWDMPLAAPQTTKEEAALTVPAWLDRARPAPEKPTVVTPSGLGGAKALPGEDGADTEDALKYGSAIHLLLEYLPDVPEADRTRAAGQLLADVSDEIAGLATQDALRLLAEPHLSHVFGPDSLAEVEIFARSPQFDGALLKGSIDRLVITADRILAVDFKSNRVIPDRPDDTPLGVLRQLGAYLAALSDLYPDHSIDLAILWTETGHLMPIPHEIVRNSLQHTAIS